MTPLLTSNTPRELHDAQLFFQDSGDVYKMSVNKGELVGAEFVKTSIGTGNIKLFDSGILTNSEESNIVSGGIYGSPGDLDRARSDLSYTSPIDQEIFFEVTRSHGPGFSYQILTYKNLLNDYNIQGDAPSNFENAVELQPGLYERSTPNLFPADAVVYPEDDGDMYKISVQNGQLITFRLIRSNTEGGGVDNARSGGKIEIYDQKIFIY
jgi:hypothetical protein